MIFFDKIKWLLDIKFLILPLIIFASACVPIKKPVPYDSPYAAKPQSHPYSEQSSGGLPNRNNAPPKLVTKSATNSATRSSIKVGLLLPLTGKNAGIGSMMRDAAMLALFDRYAINQPSQTITLMPQNAGETAASTVKAANELVSKGAQLLLGPLSSDATKAVKKQLRGKNIPVISFSNDLSIGGDNIYLIGYIAQQQVSHIIQHINSANKQHLVVLLPITGDSIIEQAVPKELAKATIPDITIVKYGSGVEDFGLVIGQMRNILQSKQTKSSIPDAILLLEGGARLEKLAGALAAASFSMPNVQYYGTGLMDSNSLLGKRDLVGAEFASTSERFYNIFATRFEHEYGYSPNKIASLSYDATFVAADLFSGDGVGITAIEGFNTPANGVVRFNLNGGNQRNLSIMRLESGGIKEIVPAKRYFSD
jgi:branched-chain amino acid transport system substrate-binding protein